MNLGICFTYNIQVHMRNATWGLQMFSCSSIRLFKMTSMYYCGRCYQQIPTQTSHRKGRRSHNIHEFCDIRCSSFTRSWSATTLCICISLYSFLQALMLFPNRYIYLFKPGGFIKIM